VFAVGNLDVERLHHLVYIAESLLLHLQRGGGAEALDHFQRFRGLPFHAQRGDHVHGQRRILAKTDERDADVVLDGELA